jgi:hypothetical protein
MRAAVASIVDGEPVKVGEMLATGAKSDPRIAESFDNVVPLDGSPPEVATLARSFLRTSGGDVEKALREFDDYVASRSYADSGFVHDVRAAIERHSERAPSSRPVGPRSPESYSLVEFRQQGRPEGRSELEAIYGGKRSPFVPGFGPLIRKSGMSLDEALTLGEGARLLLRSA